MYQIISMPHVKPVRPPMNENQPTFELPSPIALSIPWIGKGVNTPQRRYPASRTISAACSVPAVVSNSAINPCFAVVPFMRPLLPSEFRLQPVLFELGIWSAELSSVRASRFRVAQRMMRIRLIRDALDFRNRDHR